MPMAVYIQIADKKWEPGKILVPPEQKYLLDLFALYMANVMKQQLVDAINRQRFVQKWPPLTVAYVNYKRKRNLKLNIWEATGVLKNSISVWRQGNYYVVGIHPNKRYPGTKLKVLQVARYMEYGTTKMPPRPLFRPIASYLQKNIRRYWEKFLEEVSVDER